MIKLASLLSLPRTVPIALLVLLCQVGATAAPAPQVAARWVNPVVTLQLAAPKEKLLAGETMALQVTALAAGDVPVTNPKLTYKVLPSGIASVRRGVLTAKKAGAAQVTVLSGTVASNPISILVNAVGRIDVAPAGTISINAGDSVVFTAQAFDVAGNPLPNDEYPDVPLVWKSSNRTAPITQRGGLLTTRQGSTSITVVAGKTKSFPIRVIIGRRLDARSTRVLLTGEPIAGVRSLFVTIDRIEIAPEGGEYQTLLTGAQIDALVGQPVDVLALVNRRIQIGTGFLSPGDYRRMKITYSTEEGAHYFVRTDGTRVDLNFETPEDAVKEFAAYLFVTPGYPLNSVLDFRGATSVVALEDGGFAFRPDVDTSVMDDEELSHPIGALVGQIATAGVGDVWVENEDDGSGTIINYFGTLDASTGAFRIGQLPAGRYILHVALQGYPQKNIPGIVIAPGMDTVLPQPVPVGFEN